MILYNASTGVGLRNATRFLTNTSTTTYTNADLDAALNIYYELFVAEIIESMDDWDFNGEVATGNLVAGQREYVFPSDLLKIKRVEVSFDGTTWKKSTPIDVNELDVATDSSSITNNFSVSDPKHDLFDNSLFLYPAPTSNVTGGIKIYYEPLPAHLVNATDTPVFASPFHKGLCYGAAKDYFEKFIEVGKNEKKAMNAEAKMEGYIQRMKAFYRKKNQDRDYIIGGYTPDYDYGKDY